MAVVVNMHEAKTNLSRLVERALAGEDIVLARAGEPLVRLVPVVQPQRERTPGAWEDQVSLAEDFDTLPEDVLASFEGKLR